MTASALECRKVERFARSRNCRPRHASRRRGGAEKNGARRSPETMPEIYQVSHLHREVTLGRDGSVLGTFSPCRRLLDQLRGLLLEGSFEDARYGLVLPAPCGNGRSGASPRAVTRWPRPRTCARSRDRSRSSALPTSTSRTRGACCASKRSIPTRPDWAATTSSRKAG